MSFVIWQGKGGLNQQQPKRRVPFWLLVVLKAFVTSGQIDFQITVLRCTAYYNYATADVTVALDKILR